MAVAQAYRRVLGRGMARTTTEVIHDHLSRRLGGDVEGDIESNFSPDIIILSGFATYRGHQGIRESAKALAEATSGGTFSYNRTVIEGPYGFLEWTASAEDTKISDGADSFVVHDGLIVFQSIHYTAWPVGHDADASASSR